MKRECSICKTDIIEQYCSKCGQLCTGKRTTIASTLTDAITNVFSLERSVFSTIFLLIKTPKIVVDNYYEGYRHFYQSPGKLLFYALAYAALHLAFINNSLLGLTIEIDGVSPQTVFFLLFFPLFVISSKISFLKQKTGITKHTLSLLYVSGSLFIVVMFVADLLYFIIGETADTPNSFLLFLIMLFIWNSRVLSEKQTLVKITLFTFLQLLTFATLVAIGLSIAYILNPYIIVV